MRLSIVSTLFPVLFALHCLGCQGPRGFSITAGGNPVTGEMKTELKLEFESSAQRAIGHLMQQSSDLFAEEWSECAESPDPVECREQLQEVYRPHLESLVDLHRQVSGLGDSSTEAVVNQARAEVDRFARSMMNR